nr:MAG: RNA-dependent RNA polymerase [Zhejiang sediment noda-like virus 2]
MDSVTHLCSNAIARGAVVTVVVGATGYAILRRWYGGLSPYATGEPGILELAQRAMTDVSRRDIWGDKYFQPLDAFQDVKPSRSNDNGHGCSGAHRDAAREQIDAYLQAEGLRKVEINGYKCSRDGAPAIHPHVAPDDLSHPFELGEPDPLDDVLVGIDVDYYVSDWSQQLSKGSPFVLYTFAPVQVSGMDAENQFTIKDDTVYYKVHQGGLWVHQVWDWTTFGEFMVVRAKKTTWWETGMSWFGFHREIHYKIMSARPFPDAPNRALVWGIPKWSNWTHSFFPLKPAERRLKRVVYGDPARPGWNRIVVPDTDGKPLTSLGRAGESVSVTIALGHLEILMSLGSPESVTSRCIGFGITQKETMALLQQYYKGGVSNVATVSEVARPTQPKVHWPAAVLADEPVTNAKCYSSPIVSDSNLVPMARRWEALTLSIDRRVTLQTNLKVPPRWYIAYAEEFVALVVPERGVGVPYSLEHTATLLDKPSQQLAIKRIWETVDEEPRTNIEGFIKNEPTMKCGRIISSFPDARYLLSLSCFTLAFRDQVLHASHNQHWFCPGSDPRAIATKVQQYCSGVEEPAEGDFSNFDGSVSEWCHRYVMNAVMVRWFGRDFHSELKPYLNRLITSPARAKLFGFRYTAGPGVKSGSPTTCDLNTVLNGFIQYVAVRRTCPELPPDLAFQQIGLAFGDDSLFDRAYKSQWVKVAATIGMTLKVESYAPEKGVCFLARVFPDPTKTLTSFQDPLRTWRKLHITMREPGVPLETAAVDRCEGYLVTDSLTPVTGDYCRMIVRVYGPARDKDVKADIRKSRHNEKPYWLTYGGSWPQEEDDRELMLECMAARLGVFTDTLEDMCQSLSEATDPWNLPTLYRDDDILPVVDTLDKDCLPVEGVVDARKVARDTKLVESTANGATSELTNASRDAGIKPSPGDFPSGSRPAELGDPNSRIGSDASSSARCPSKTQGSRPPERSGELQGPPRQGAGRGEIRGSGAAAKTSRPGLPRASTYRGGRGRGFDRGRGPSRGGRGSSFGVTENLGCKLK